MCPSPWGLPTKAQIEDLSSQAKPADLINYWGLGGSADVQGMNDYDDVVYYWSSSLIEESASEGYALKYSDDAIIAAEALRINGLQVRCVK